MSNLTDFIGGGSLQGGGAEKSSSLITDGTNTLGDATSSYELEYSYAKLDGSIAMNNYDGVTQGIALINRRIIEKNVTIPKINTVTSASRDFFGLECTNLNIEGILDLPQTYRTIVSPIGFSAGGAHPAASISGTNMLFGIWDFMPRGGDGGGNTNTYSSSIGGIGFSGGGHGGTNSADPGGDGGGLIFLIADLINGNGSINAKGGNGTGYGYGGGGGMVVILTKSWAGTTSINVAGGVNTSKDITYDGQEGSYCILKINTDNSLTLMVHSQNGSSADLNGQTPVYGADASIAW